MVLEQIENTGYIPHVTPYIQDRLDEIGLRLQTQPQDLTLITV